MTKGALDVTQLLPDSVGGMNQKTFLRNSLKLSNKDAETGEAHLISRSLTKYGLFHLEECKFSETDPASFRTCSWDWQRSLATKCITDHANFPTQAVTEAKFRNDFCSSETRFFLHRRALY